MFFYEFDATMERLEIEGTFNGAGGRTLNTTSYRGTTMSVDLSVHLRRTAMPTPSKWQAAILAAGFPVEIDTDFDVDKFTGFLPCRFDSQPSGFEYFASPLVRQEASGKGAPSQSDFRVMFTTHSDLRELAASLAAASVLCQVSGGLLDDPQSGESYSGAAAVEWAKQELEQLRRHIK